VASSWGTSWLTSWADSWGTTGAVAAAAVEEGPHGPGWRLFGKDAHPTWKRSRKVEDLEQDIIRAYEDATGITAEKGRLEAIRELKRAAATALSVAKKENDARLATLSSGIIALRNLELTAAEYLALAGELIAKLDDEEDDMEALMLMARLT
jgi:hypothetical protein